MTELDPPSLKQDCKEAVRVLYTFLDDELTTESREQIQTHLDDCHPCLEAFEFEVELRQLVQRKCRDRIPDEFLQRLGRLLEDEPPSP